MNSNVENAGLEKLKEAFREINQWEYENLHLETLEEVIPSPRYQKRMERLIKRQKQSYWKYVNTVGKRVAVFAVVLILTFALSMSVSAVRKPIVEFFVNVYEKFVEFFYDEDDVARAPETIETVYTLGYVPEEYELAREEIGDLVTHFVWTNEIDDQITFSQGLLGGYSLMDNESSNYKIYYMGDMSVACLEKENNKYYYWYTEDYRFTLHISREVSYESVQEIINSIIKCEEKP